jgi:hypothetical protein
MDARVARRPADPPADPGLDRRSSRCRPFPGPARRRPFAGPVRGTPGAAYDTWALIGTSFEGTGKSVVFGGTANYIGFDNVTFGSNIPAPGALALIAAAGFATRRRRA